MATRVEVGSIASLRAGPGLGDISREETLKRTYFCQAGDIPGAPTTRILTTKTSLQTRLSPLPVAPRPFLKEQVPERKTSVKSSWPGTSQPCPSAQSAKEEAKVDSGKKMPSLAGEEADRGEAPQNGPSVPNKATSLRSGPSTMGFFETTKAGPSPGKGICEGSWEASSQATQASLLSVRPEVATKPALPARKPPVTLPRPTSLSQDPGSTVSQGEAGQAQPLPKARSVEDPTGQAPEAKPQPKRRPLSAVYSECSEYLLSPKPGAGGVAVTGKVPPPPPEKTWVRRPRPLSVDLTSIFESGDTFLKKVATEQSTAEHQGPERTSMEPRGDAEGPARMDATPQDPDADFQELAKRLHARREKMVLRQAETDGPRTPRVRATPGDDQSPQEEEAMSGQQSEKVQESPSTRPGGAPGLTEVKGGRFDQEAYAQAERKPTGSVRKRLSLFGEDSAAVALAVASEPTPVTLESLSTLPEPSRAGVNVQARIKGWTVENAGEKPEVRRRVPQARPLPADLTKPFSRTASSNEIGHEKCATLGVEFPGERREKLKERHDLDGVPVTKSPWKNGVPQKSKQTELKGSSDQENPNRCWSARSAGDTGPSEVSPEDGGSFQKVWATVFEYHVERHTVADQASRCLSTAPPRDVADTPPVPKPRPEDWPGKEPPGGTDRRDSSRWPSDHADPGMLGRAALVDVERRQYPTPVPEVRPTEERHSRSVPRHLESPPVSQRVQPTYDIVHASGERAHSEAVSRVPEEKAVTLRSGKPQLSLAVQQLPQEVISSYSGRSPQANGGSVQRAGLIWEARGKEGSGQKLDCQQTRDGFGDTCQSPKWTGRGVASWHGSAVVNKDLSTAQRGPTWNVSSSPPSRTNVEPCDSQVQAGPDSLSPQRGSLVVASEDNPMLAQVSQPEVRMRRSNPSEPRLDRFRRRTLPHDVKFDLFVPEGSTKTQQRPADGLSSPACALKRPPSSHQQTQTQEVTPDAPQGRTFLVEKPGPSAEPTATFFAVTYQVPNIQKAKSVVKSGPEGASEPSRKTPPPLSPRSVVPVLASPGHEEPRSPASSKGRDFEEAWNLSKHPKSTDQPTTSAGDRTLDLSRDRIIDVDALRLHRGSEDGAVKDRRIGAPSGRDAPQTSPVLRQRPKSLLVRRRAEVISETFPGKMRDGYRSSVLDLDALMAEYKEQPSRITSKTQGRQDSPPAEPSGSPQERSGWPKKAEWRRRSLKEDPQSDSVGQQAGRTVKALHSPGPSKQPTEPLGAAMATKSGLPLWAPPHSASGENSPSPSAVPAGSRRKSPGIAEFESKPSSSEHQGTKHRQSSAKSQEPGSGDPVSPGSPPSDRKKGTPRRSTGQGVEGHGVPWGTPPRDSVWLPLDIKRTCSEKGPPARIREGLSVMQDARQRRQEQSKGKPDLPTTETPKAAAGPCERDSRRPEGPKTPLQNPEQRDDRQDSQQPQRQVSPVASVPRRSHSFCKDKRNSPLVNQLKQCFSRRAPEAKDTDTLVQEADSQYGTWADQHQNGGSFGPETPESPDSSAASAGKQPPGSHLSSYTESTSVEQHDSSRDRRSSSVDRSSSELESTDGPEGPPPSDACPAEEADFSFIHQTSVLDSSALKTRVQLSKRSRRRAPISHSLRRSQFSESESRSPLEEESHSTWMFKDSTEEKSPRRDESDEEPPRVERTPVSHLQRMPVFPGMDPAVLKAQLPKRTEVGSPGDSLSWTPQPKSPKSPFHPGVLRSRVLPSTTEKEKRSEECSPQWLKELKSKKRQSLYENQA
ncbi:uncharacterized protein KIAA1671 homolog isoform X1 [Mus pahari]|uniref:uncharacterized protein KIAA1671 homolog isoform X1 n=1 Tax=Mus pahari TaxID=10093 RepID=UPI001114E96A|nr:uncharacterized protein KIAA1671 homolog isoform X1 [Mus pahari]XP_029389468.1 uncharacterized protein KIAA1671 homolog isoform X1 [Mus pahari]XP_029389469.1 uncharacterized protein KIAA1671 homolog isoform X1 [Mus pahari]XP_029389470.1 uncharacterized protein KIAA1671 homolog isoform X1 [Mus pahari]XP_029389471.1 uncharacterized protein KIAA1671 homolog isoform X1 [Mus pahari]